MHTIFSKAVLRKAALLFFSVASFSFAGCMDDDFEVPEPTPVTYVSFYQGSPDAPAMDIQLNGSVVNSQAFKYGTFSGYVNLKPDTYSVKFTPAGAANAYFDSSLNFKEGKAYSLFSVNKLENIELLVVQDSIKAPATGKAALRIIHLSPDAPTLKVGTVETTSALLASDLGFKGITPFVELEGGRQTIQVKSAETDEVLLTVSDTNFTAGVTYSLIIRGFKTPPTGNTNTLSAQLIKNY